MKNKDELIKFFINDVNALEKHINNISLYNLIFSIILHSFSLLPKLLLSEE